MDAAHGLLDYLKTLGADRMPHSGRSLMDHLVGTYEILRSWDCGTPVCVAGMFHSIYGTNAFGIRCMDMRDRASVMRAVGEEAERFVHLFCVSHRPDAFIEAIDRGELKCRNTGEIVPVDAATVHGLLEIECANLLEQHAGERFLRKFVEKIGRTERERFSRRMIEDVVGYLDSSATALPEGA